MTEKTLTPWFPPEVKPVRDGVYETQIDAVYPDQCPTFKKWNGNLWGPSSYSADNAAIRSGQSFVQEVYWRGLAKKPK